MIFDSREEINLEIGGDKKVMNITSGQVYEKFGLNGRTGDRHR